MSFHERIWQVVASLRGSVNVVSGDVDSVRKQLAALTAALTASLGGYSLIGNPEGYIRMTILVWVTETAYGVVDWVGKQILSMNEMFQGAVFGSLGAAGDPFRIVGGILLDQMVSVNDVFVGLAGMAGPFAVFVPPLMWFLTFGTLTYIGGLFLQVIKWLT